MDGQKIPLELRGPKKESREAPKRWGKEERKERKKIINIAEIIVYFWATGPTSIRID